MTQGPANIKKPNTVYGPCYNYNLLAAKKDYRFVSVKTNKQTDEIEKGPIENAFRDLATFNTPQPYASFYIQYCVFECRKMTYWDK